MQRQLSLLAAAVTLTALLVATLSAVTNAAAWTMPTEAYVPTAGCPATPDATPSKAVPPNKAVYPICADQRALLADAMAKAAAEKKLLVVSFGATWCPWCSTYQRLIVAPEVMGKRTTGIDPAAVFHHVEIALSTVRAGKKEVVPTGETVLATLLAKTGGAKLRAIPFLVVIDPADGRRAYARNLDDLQIESQGVHDGERLRAILVEAHAFHRSGGAAASEPGWLARRWSRIWGG